MKLKKQSTKFVDCHQQKMRARRCARRAPRMPGESFGHAWVD